MPTISSRRFADGTILHQREHTDGRFGWWCGTVRGPSGRLHPIIHIEPFASLEVGIPAMVAVNSSISISGTLRVADDGALELMVPAKSDYRSLDRLTELERLATERSTEERIARLEAMPQPDLAHLVMQLDRVAEEATFRIAELERQVAALIAGRQP